MSIEHLTQGERFEDGADPYSDPEVLAAAALTRFAWGHSGQEYRDAYLELMSQRYGLDEQASREVLARLNSTRSSGVEGLTGDEQ
jgi:hypothetical protein